MFNFCKFRAFNIVELKFIENFHLTGVQRGPRNKFRASLLNQMKERTNFLKNQNEYPTSRRSEFLEWDFDAELYALGRRFDENFDPALLKESLTASSHIINEENCLRELGMDQSVMALKTNKELSAIGRNLIKDHCSEYVRARCPLLPEEAIRNFGDYISSNEVLGRIGSEMGLKDLILCHRYPPSEAAISSSFAAIIASLNISSGPSRCHGFIKEFVIPHLAGKDIWDIWKVDDPFFVLENILVKNGYGRPKPRLIGEVAGKTIEAVFCIGMYDAYRKFLGHGFGNTVNEALQTSAYNSLGNMLDYGVSKKPFDFKNSATLVNLNNKNV